MFRVDRIIRVVTWLLAAGFLALVGFRQGLFSATIYLFVCEFGIQGLLKQRMERGLSATPAIVIVSGYTLLMALMTYGAGVVNVPQNMSAVIVEKQRVVDGGTSAWHYPSSAVVLLPNDTIPVVSAVAGEGLKAKVRFYVECKIRPEARLVVAKKGSLKGVAEILEAAVNEAIAKDLAGLEVSDVEAKRIELEKKCRETLPQLCPELELTGFGIAFASPVEPKS